MTFAGSPDRVEARLVPEAGYELDTFRDLGPAAPPGSGARARAAARRARAALPARAILERRRPRRRPRRRRLRRGADGLAAWRLRIPAALSEADAHLGLANRLAAPFARRVFLAYPSCPAAAARSTASSGGRFPARAAARPQAEARAIFGLPPEGPVLLVAGALRARGR